MENNELRPGERFVIQESFGGAEETLRFWVYIHFKHSQNSRLLDGNLSGWRRCRAQEQERRNRVGASEGQGRKGEGGEMGDDRVSRTQ